MSVRTGTIEWYEIPLILAILFFVLVVLPALGVWYTLADKIRGKVQSSCHLVPKVVDLPSSNTADGGA